jgi:hypothetical protein
MYFSYAVYCEKVQYVVLMLVFFNPQVGCRRQSRITAVPVAIPGCPVPKFRYSLYRILKMLFQILLQYIFNQKAHKFMPDIKKVLSPFVSNVR